MEKTFNIKNFVDILNTLDHSNMIRIYFNDVIHFYNQSLGGCGCNRKAREDKAEIVFIEKITNLDSERVEDLKKIIDCKLINFIRRDNFIFKTF